MVTGLRRGELLALRWTDIDLRAGKVNVERSYSRRDRRSIEKDTKTHQMRRISLDPATVDVLNEHWQRYQAAMVQLGVEPRADAFLFSYEPMRDARVTPAA